MPLGSTGKSAGTAADGTATADASYARSRHPKIELKLTKKESIADAEASVLGAFKTPKNTLGRKLISIEVNEKTPEGAAIPVSDRAVGLRYGLDSASGDMHLAVEPRPTESEALGMIEGHGDANLEAAGFLRSTKVGDHPAWAAKRGFQDIGKDSSGRVTRLGIRSRSSWLRWADGNVVYTLTSETLSWQDMLPVAESMSR